MGKSIAQRSRKVTEGDWDWWPNIFGEWPELPGENHVNEGKHRTEVTEATEGGLVAEIFGERLSSRARTT
jgi:hypothetical protein